MRDRLSALPGFSPEEELKVSMLLTQSILIGIFIGAFDITAYSLLLSTFDEKLMTRGFIVSGVAAFFLTSIYLKLRSESDTGKFTAGNLIFILASTASLWLALNYSSQTWIIFLLFVMLAPLNILSFLGFWKIAERLFKTKTDKIFRFLEGGIITGIMIVSFAIILVSSFNVQTSNILLISISSIFSALVVQIMINKRFDLNLAVEVNYTEDVANRFPLLTRFDPHKKTLDIFIALTVLSAFVIQYLFMAVTRKQFPVSEDMAAFLGLFTGIMMIANLFVKFLVFPYIRHHFRVNVSLLISPLVIAGLSIISIVACFSLNATQATEGYLIIVLILGFNRLVSKSFIDSVEIPSYKILFQFLNKKSRREIQAGIDGAVNEIGLILSGIILAGLGILSFINLIHFSLLLLVISLISVFIGVKLLKKYRSSLKIAGTNEREQEHEKKIVLKSKFASGLEFRKDYFRIISGNYSVLNNISPTYFEVLSEHALSKNDINLIPALRKIVSNSSLESGLKQRSQEIIDNLNRNVVSDDGTRLLAGTRLPQTTEILRLLRNNSIESKRQAIHIIGKFRICDLLSVVCESLNTPGLSLDAYEILLSFREGVEDELVRFYLINSGNLKLSRLILQLLGNTCSKESTGFLFSHLWSNSRQIKEISIRSLLNCKFKPSAEENIRLDNLIFDTIGIITWNMGAEIILEREKNKFLLDIIRQENERWISFLYSILSLAYGKDIIAVVRENLSEGTMESTSHALEIVREVASDSIKPVLVILFDDLSLRKKLKMLSVYYPAEVSGHNNLAEDIINRDYNRISIWAKACTLRNMNMIEGREMSESVTALLFSPEDIIREEAAYLIARSNPELYISASERISSQVKRKLDKIFDGTSDKKELLFEKVQFLKDRFGGIPAWDLFALAGELQFVNDHDENPADCVSNCIFWFLNGEQNKYYAQTVYNESDPGIGISAKLPVYRLSLSSIEEFHFHYPHNSHLLLGYVEKIHETF